MKEPIWLRIAGLVLGTSIIAVMSVTLMYERRGSERPSITPGARTDVEEGRLKSDLPEQNVGGETKWATVPSSPVEYDIERWKRTTANLWDQVEGPRSGRALATFRLANFLEREGDEFFFEDIERMLEDPDTSRDTRQKILNLMRQTTSVAAINTMTDWLDVESEEYFVANIGWSIEEVAREGSLKDSDARTDMSLALGEAFWDLQDEEKYTPIARGISRLGTMEGVDMLLDVLADGPRSIEDAREWDGVRGARARAVLGAAEEMRVNDEAAPLLIENLNNTKDDRDDPVFLFAGTGLASMASKEAAEALVDWAAEAPDEAAPLADQWIAGVMRRTEGSGVIREAIESGEEFRSTRIREGIVRAVKDDSEWLE